MTNTMYGKGKVHLLTDIDILADTIKAVLLDSAVYTPNFSTDEFYSTASSAAVGTPVALASKTLTLGVFDAADTTILAAPGPKNCAIGLFKDTGSAATSPLINYYDTGTGLLVPTNGGDIVIQWDNGPNKIFKI